MRSATEEERLLEDAARAVEMARAAGADDVSAAVSRGRSTEFEWRDGRVEKVQEDQSRGLSVQIYVEGRYGAHATNDLEPGPLRAFLEEAVRMTRRLQPDPYRKIPDPRLYADRADLDLDLLDPRILGLSREDRLDACRRLEEAARAHEDVISVTAFFQDGSGTSARVTSNGFSGVRTSTSVWYGATVTIREDELKRPEATRYQGGTHLAGLLAPEEVGREALGRALARRGARKLPSVRTNLVLHPEAGPALLGRVFGALSAGAIQQGQSFLAERLGQQIAAPLLDVRDDPWIPGLLGSRLYDGEGITARPRPVIRDGVLDTYFVDTYYGRKLGWEPTTGSSSNLVFRHGPEDLAGLLAAVGDGIHVTSWLGGNANMTTGDFSFGIRGFRLAGGRLAEPVAEMNVTGSYPDLLRRLTHVGNDPVPWSSCRTPTLVFSDVQFSGA